MLIGKIPGIRYIKPGSARAAPFAAQGCDIRKSSTMAMTK
jgi:hypothetical protein